MGLAVIVQPPSATSMLNMSVEKWLRVKKFGGQSASTAGTSASAPFSMSEISCPYQATPKFHQRPANALNTEPMQPCFPRCRKKTPTNWGDRDPLATRWLGSGGSPSVLGFCTPAQCNEVTLKDPQ